MDQWGKRAPKTGVFETSLDNLGRQSQAAASRRLRAAGVSILRRLHDGGISRRPCGAGAATPASSGAAQAARRRCCRCHQRRRSQAMRQSCCRSPATRAAASRQLRGGGTVARLRLEQRRLAQLQASPAAGGAAPRLRGRGAAARLPLEQGRARRRGPAVSAARVCCARYAAVVLPLACHSSRGAPVVAARQ